MAADESAFRRALIAVLARGWESLDALQDDDPPRRSRAEQILRLELLLLDDARRRLEREGRLSQRQALELAFAIDLLRRGVTGPGRPEAPRERATAVQNAIFERVLELDERPGRRLATG